MAVQIREPLLKCIRGAEAYKRRSGWRSLSCVPGEKIARLNPSCVGLAHVQEFRTWIRNPCMSIGIDIGIDILK